MTNERAAHSDKPLTTLILGAGFSHAAGLGLNDDEVAFYDALAQNNSAIEVMGNDNLKVIATELVTQVRKSVTIDWTLRAVTDAKQRPGFQRARAKIKVLVKRIEIRSLPAVAHCFPRSFTFYVVHSVYSILRKHGYPPDRQDEATKLVLQQAELLCAEWAA